MDFSRKRRKPTVQLTSLLDLLFIMIFISLLQSKDMPPIGEYMREAAPQAEQEVEVTTPAATPTSTPAPPREIRVQASFQFYATDSNPLIPPGSYIMEGSFERNSGELRLNGVRWTQRPDGYDMVPLTGKINAARTQFTGRIEFPGCEEFTLQRRVEGSGSPVAGEWMGSYVCSQGETGLTLVIY